MGAAVSAETVRSLTKRAGGIARGARYAAVAAVVAPAAGQVRAPDAAERAHRPSSIAPAAPPPARRLAGKVSVVATEARGALPDPAAEQGGLGAGAAWIKTPAGRHCPRAVTILDWPHVARAGHEAIRAARRPAPGTDAPKALEGVLTALRQQRAWHGSSQAWRATGYPVGSGLVERAGALVITRRMQRQGLRWKRGDASGTPPSPPFLREPRASGPRGGWAGAGQRAARWRAPWPAR